MKKTFKILQLKRKPSTGLVLEVTYSINFELEGMTFRRTNSINLNGDENLPTFIPYESLTEQIVIDWVVSLLGSDKIQQLEQDANLYFQQLIQQRLNPPFLFGKPWS
jgi:hypothetical protein